MAGLQNLLEDYRNWSGLQDWKYKKQLEQMFGGDPQLQEDFEKLSGGFSTSNLGGGLSGMAGMIKASHGSPHAYTKFDFSKMGSGEGAQAYGYGGYFAQGFDSPVAADYQQMLSRKEGLQSMIGNKNIADYYMALENKANKLPPDKAATEYEKLAFLEDLEQQPSFQAALARIDDESIIDWAKALEPQYKPAGHMYNVELKWPDAAREAADPLGEHHLLDWDAPLSEQNSIINLLAKSRSKIVRDVISQLGDISQPRKIYDEDIGLMTGEDLHRRLALNFEGRAGSSKKASSAFAKAGIPGIRYLDQASRSAGTGSRNYVMFDDRFPNIVSRNGVSLADLLRK